MSSRIEKKDLKKVFFRHLSIGSMNDYQGVLHHGYSMGMDFIAKSEKSGIIDKVSYACSVVGLMAIGAMIFYTVKVGTPITIGDVKNGGLVLQDTLNSVMPGMLSIILIGIEYWLLKKGVKVVPLIIGTMIVGVILFALGVIA